LSGIFIITGFSLSQLSASHNPNGFHCSLERGG
jgi:hypothetical protein